MGLRWRALDALPLDEQAEVLGYYEATQGSQHATRGIPTRATKKASL